MSDYDFTEDELRLIKAMCITANPGFPEKEMFPAFQAVYDKACIQLERKEIEKVYGPDLVDHVMHRDQTLEAHMSHRPL